MPADFGFCFGDSRSFPRQSRYRIVFYWSLILVAVGVVELGLLSSLGGIGGSRTHSIWWGLVVLPYPVGWILGLAGVILELADILKPPVLNRS